MKKILLPVAFTASLFLFACGNSTEHKHEEVMPVADTSNGVSVMTTDSIHGDQASLTYICPCGGCPEVRESNPGKCPKCEMDLVKEKK